MTKPASKRAETRVVPVAHEPASFTPSQVLQFIHSLYADELKPFGRILRKRVSEHVSGCVDSTVGSIAQVYAACLSLQEDGIVTLHPEHGGDWSVLLKGRPANFIDVYSNEDLYLPSLWHQVSTYLDSLDHETMKFPGGRYSCAQAIVERRLPFFAGFSLGRICHVVQLAVSQRKLLGYLHGFLVPYAHSQSKVKDECASQQQICAGASDFSHLPLATWDTARSCVREMLADAAKEGSPTVPISNVKRLFRSRFNLELSETTLGHTKLSELLQDSQFDGVCTVQLQAQGYMVVPSSSEEQPPAHHEDSTTSKRTVFCENEPLCFDDDECNASVEPFQPPAKYPCLSPSVLSKDGTVGKLVHNTFIHQAMPPPTPVPGARRRACSLPKDLGSDKSSWETTCHALSYLHAAVPSVGVTREPLGHGDVTEESSRWSLRPSSRRGSSTVPENSPRRGSCSDPLKLLLAECASSAGSLELGWASGDGLWPGALEPLCSPAFFAEYGRTTEPGAELRHQVICEHEPVWLKEVATSVCATPPAPPAAKYSCLSPTTPFKDCSVGQIVRNTFIHQVAAPPTPVPGARFRSLSLPKDLGSDESSCETACHALSFLNKTVNSEAGTTTIEGLDPDSFALQSRVVDGNFWPCTADSREQAFDPLKVWLSGASTAVAPTHPCPSLASAGTILPCPESEKELVGGCAHNTKVHEFLCAPLHAAVPSVQSYSDEKGTVGEMHLSDSALHASNLRDVGILLPDQIGVNCGSAPCATPEPSPLYGSVSWNWSLSGTVHPPQQAGEGGKLCLADLLGAPSHSFWPGLVAGSA